MTAELSGDAKRRLSPVIDRLSEQFAGIFSRETIERCVEESAEHWWSDVAVANYVPIFVERFARQLLSSLAMNEGRIMKTRPVVLFVCVHNAGRSQMAAALLDHYANGAVDVRSAGSTPADEVNPVVIEAMRELDIDISKGFPKPLSDEVVQASDVVVTMGCGDACPVFPGKRYLDWDLPDPAGRPIEEVRPIRDEIDRMVQALMAEVVGRP